MTEPTYNNNIIFSPILHYLVVLYCRSVLDETTIRMDDRQTSPTSDSSPERAPLFDDSPLWGL
jgi:hypothetical protein